MKKKHLQPLTPAAFYARVSSDRQDVDLSVSAQLRALKDYARANGYSVARQYVDEAESGRVADRPRACTSCRHLPVCRPFVPSPSTLTSMAPGTTGGLPPAMIASLPLPASLLPGGIPSCIFLEGHLSY